MTHDEMVAVILAHKTGKKIEWTECGRDDVWLPAHRPSWDFNKYDYRVAPPALRPHWQAVFTSTAGVSSISDRLFTSLNAAEASVGPGITNVRLVTEYPPVMLP